MSNITNIDDYKKGKDMGRQLLESLNFDSENFYKTIKPSQYYKQNFNNAMAIIIKTTQLMTMYDVAVFFQGISLNRKVKTDVRELAEYIFRYMDFENILKSDVKFYNSSIYRVIINDFEQNDKRISKVNACHFFKAILEQPEDITIYDICVMIRGLNGLSNLESDQLNKVTGLLKSKYNTTCDSFIKDREFYKKSLMSKYLNMPIKKK